MGLMFGVHGRVIAYSAIAAFGGLIFGLDAVLISGGEEQIRNEFELNEFARGAVVSAPGLGVLPALLLTGWICNSLGRKKTLIGVAALYVVSAVWSALAPTAFQLGAARFLGGLAFTSLSLSPMYIGEIAPAHLRGKLVAINQINTVIGLSGAYFVNLAIIYLSQAGGAGSEPLGLPPGTWRYMLGSEIPPAVLWLGLLFLIPESPRWLVSRGRNAEAELALRKLYPGEEVADKLAEIDHALANEPKGLPAFPQFLRLLGPGFRLAVIVGATIAIAQQATGINAILFYAPTVFKQLGMGENAAFVQAAVLGVVSLVFAMLALAVVDRVGRRPVALIGFVWIIASLAVCAYGFSRATYQLSEERLEGLPEELSSETLLPILGETYTSDTDFKQAIAATLGETEGRPYETALLEQAVTLPAELIVAGILSFMAAFQFSVGPVMWILLSEIFPTSVRGVAIPFFHFLTGATSYFVQFLFPAALATLGAAAVFASFTVIPLVGLVVLYLYLPETKNLSIEQIQSTFQQHGLAGEGGSP
ncbi:MAG: MFS transporter [Planctomycetota bacterium]